MSKHEPRCPRVVTEKWTPGSHASPDGPSRDMQGRCVLGVGHVLSENDNETRHIYGDWLEVGK